MKALMLKEHKAKWTRGRKSITLNGYVAENLLCRMDLQPKGYETLRNIYIWNEILGMKHENWHTYNLTCTTDTAQTPNHPTLTYNIFTSTLGIKCTLPVSYARQQPRAAPVVPHLPHHFIYSRHRTRWSSAYSLTHIQSLFFIVAGFWTSFWTSFGYLQHYFGFHPLWLLAK